MDIYGKIALTSFTALLVEGLGEVSMSMSVFASLLSATAPLLPLKLA